MYSTYLKGPLLYHSFSENVTVPSSHSLETFVFVWESSVVIMKADIMLVSCSARQAKQSHLSPSRLTMRANRTSAEKTVPSTSARWAAGPTADPAVYLRALIVDTLLVLYILPRLGYVWNGHRKTHALGNWLEFNRSKACFLLLSGPLESDPDNVLDFVSL